MLTLTHVVLAVALAGTGVAQASPTAAPAAASTPQLQAVARSDFGAADFLYTFPPVPNTPQSLDGSVRGLFGDATPALATLPSSGLGQTLITLIACGVYTPHHHPRFCYHRLPEENPGTTSTGAKYGGRLLNETVPTGSSYVIPQGLIHYISNPGCTNATLIGSYDNRDPGVVTSAPQFFQLPTEVIAAATGLNLLDISFVQQRLAQQGIVALDSTCAETCGNATTSTAPAAAPGR